MTQTEETKAGKCSSTDYTVLVLKDHPNLCHPMRH